MRGWVDDVVGGGGVCGKIERVGCGKLPIVVAPVGRDEREVLELESKSRQRLSCACVRCQTVSTGSICFERDAFISFSSAPKSKLWKDTN